MTSPRPVIGITTFPRVVETAIGPTALHTVGHHYVDAVAAAGGVALAVPVLAADVAPEVLSALDGLVLIGGTDVDPSHYGEQRHERTRYVDPVRDDFELALASAALEDPALPVLGVCRGMQLLNVALGGSLDQHVHDGTGFDHDRVDRWDAEVHGVRVDPASCLAEVVGAPELRVNSLHHQAVGRPGAGVRPVAWADDGTVEAIEVDGRPSLLAVQWHPELTAARDARSAALFAHIVWLGSQRASKRR